MQLCLAPVYFRVKGIQERVPQDKLVISQTCEVKPYIKPHVGHLPLMTDFEPAVETNLASVIFGPVHIVHSKWSC